MLREEVVALQSQVVELRSQLAAAGVDIERADWKPLRRMIQASMTDVRMEEVVNDKTTFAKCVVARDIYGEMTRNVKWDAPRLAEKYTYEQLLEAFREEGMDAPKACSKPWLAMMIAAHKPCSDWLRDIPKRPRHHLDFPSMWD